MSSFLLLRNLVTKMQQLTDKRLTCLLNLSSILPFMLPFPFFVVSTSSTTDKESVSSNSLTVRHSRCFSRLRIIMWIDIRSFVFPYLASSSFQQNSRHSNPFDIPSLTDDFQKSKYDSSDLTQILLPFMNPIKIRRKDFWYSLHPSVFCFDLSQIENNVFSACVIVRVVNLVLLNNNGLMTTDVYRETHHRRHLHHINERCLRCFLIFLDKNISNMWRKKTIREWIRTKTLDGNEKESNSLSARIRRESASINRWIFRFTCSCSLMGRLHEK
jgi:hypothetical protein